MGIKFPNPGSNNIFIFYFESPALVFQKICNFKMYFNSIFTNLYKIIFVYTLYILQIISP